MGNKRCWAEIDLGALCHNLAVIREKIGPRVQVMVVVKANAYGHGVDQVVTKLNNSVEMFGVANIKEAQQLRKFVPTAKVFILGPALPDERAEIVRNNFIPSVSNFEEALNYNNIAGDKRFLIHLVIDTGMGRIGVWQDEVMETVREILKLPNIEIAGIATHLPVADEDEIFTEEQLAHFTKISSQLLEIGLKAPVIHSLNSAGVIGFNHFAQDMVRTGLMLYGSSPFPEFQHQLRAVMTWKTRVTLVREVGTGRSISYGRTFITPRKMRVATLGMGYADGYARHLSGQGVDVLIQGRRCPLLGRVTMDQIVVDVSDLLTVVPGEEVILIGKQGKEEILVSELAQKAGTIAWEFFTGISNRVERIYV